MKNCYSQKEVGISDLLENKYWNKKGKDVIRKLGCSLISEEITSAIKQSFTCISALNSMSLYGCTMSVLVFRVVL